MQVQMETLGQLERRLNFAIPMGEIDAAVDARLKGVARGAKIQGFRPGKAPLKIVAQNYGPQVREEVLGEKVQSSFASAVQAQQLRVAGYPRFEALPAESTTEFRFAAVFEVYPEVSIGDLSSKEIERPTLEVSDVEVDKTIDILRKQRTRFEHVERAVAKGDRIVVDFSGKIDGVEFAGGSAKNYAFLAGEGQMLPEFDAAVIDMKDGETKSFDLSFPEDYHGKDVAGKTAIFEVTVRNVSEPRLPEIDADFAKALGIEDGDVEKMRAEIRKNVSREVKRRLQARAKESVMQALLDVTTIELPKSLVGLEIGRLIEQAREEMRSRGFDPKEMPFPPELFEEQAKRRVALGLILAELVRANGLEAKPEQVKALVQEFAESYEHPEDVVKWYYASADRLDGPEAMVMEDNVVAYVYGVAKPIDKVLTFDELMGNA
ncbi:trigger factor [Parachitinimonas caeni]|uniref:Trigger factor n=1 Tax=Parachitinimonas caeni TaxID=3031301 RepID=A0ABT7DXM8_9NEIS|nr:trigger factor [Parachitinimonas caeni]MDK2123402.1 trigger factor [Parachitinimonas caeni]